MSKLFKTTIVIWSEFNPEGVYEIDRLSQEAMSGMAYCSKQKTEEVKEPTSDPDWDGTEFFEHPEE